MKSAAFFLLVFIFSESGAVPRPGRPPAAVSRAQASQNPAKQTSREGRSAKRAAKRPSGRISDRSYSLQGARRRERRPGDEFPSESQDPQERRIARGVIIKFRKNLPSRKNRNKLREILKSRSLKKTKNLRSFQSQLAEWESGGLKTLRQAESACAKIEKLSFVERCNADFLLPSLSDANESVRLKSTGFSLTEAGFSDVSPKDETLEAGFSPECVSCREPLVNPGPGGSLSFAPTDIRTCNLISHKRELMDGDLSDYWAQEMTGADLLRKELEKISLPQRKNWIAAFDTPGQDRHDISVKNIISGDGPQAVLPELSNTAVHDTTDNDQYKSVFADYQTQFPGDYMRHAENIQKTAPHFINNSMKWRENEVIYDVFKKLSPPSVIVVGAGNDFPQELDKMQIKASKELDIVLVGSLGPNGTASDFSQSGEEIHILAPSDTWLSSVGQHGEYKKFGGTSGAAPQVTGALAGFEALSGYHPSTEEAKILLRKTAFPTLHSHEEPQMNGAGLLNSFKLGEVAKRLKKKCQNKSSFCFKEEILNEENYRFDQDESLNGDLKDVFPKCAANRVQSPEEEPADCERKGRAFERLRKAIFLNPKESREFVKTLSCIYAEGDFHQNAKAYDMLSAALGSKDEARAAARRFFRGDPKNRKNAVRLMAGLGGLEEEISGDERTLKEALDMTSGLSAKAALPLLERGFDSGDRALQTAALISASKTGEAGLPLLERGFESGDRELQGLALVSAGKMDETALPLLEKGFASGDRALQAAALMSAGEIGEAGLPLLERGFDSNNRELQRKSLVAASNIGEAALPLLEKGFASGDIALQTAALMSAGEIGEAGLPLLERGFDSNNRELQRKSLVAASNIGEAALPLLEKGFASGDIALQTAALMSAGEVGEAGLPLLERGFDSNNRELQKTALRSAFFFTSEAALPLLERGFDSGDRELQRQSLAAASNIGETALPLLERGFDSGDRRLQNLALAAARNIGAAALPLLERGFESGDRKLQERALISTFYMDEAALPLMEKAFHVLDSSMQENLLDTAKSFGPPALPLIEKILDNSADNEYLQEKAIQSAAATGPAAKPFLRRMLTSPKTAASLKETIREEMRKL